jgi:hypothetical protein
MKKNPYLAVADQRSFRLGQVSNILTGRQAGGLWIQGFKRAGIQTFGAVAQILSLLYLIETITEK